MAEFVAGNGRTGQAHLYSSDLAVRQQCWPSPLWHLMWIICVVCRCLTGPAAEPHQDDVSKIE